VNTGRVKKYQWMNLTEQPQQILFSVKKSLDAGSWGNVFDYAGFLTHPS
jgi:hypothetical protein